jgi:hypothetical protein
LKHNYKDIIIVLPRDGKSKTVENKISSQSIPKHFSMGISRNTKEHIREDERQKERERDKKALMNNLIVCIQ